MILTHLKGGLGNQMFQYACGRALAERLGTQLKLIISGYENQNLRHYELNDFNIIENIATPEEIMFTQIATTKPAGIRSLLRWLQTNRHWHCIIEESTHHYQEAIEYSPARKNIYLTGFWESEKYFQDQTAIIRNEFTLRQPFSAKNQTLAEEMQANQSVSVHIRRGDYVNLPETKKKALVCTLPYYQEAMARIAQEVSAPKFYIFSDDPDWCAANIHSEHPIEIVSSNNNRPSHEIVLMSRCRHHILSNSSFGWWGAWLNNDSNKQIIIPDRWFRNTYTTDRIIIPSHWQTTMLSTNSAD